MATIITTDTNKTFEYSMNCDTQDVLSEIIGNTGRYLRKDDAWIMDEEDALWWVAYGIRADAIDDAFASSDFETGKMHNELYDLWGNDLEDLQRAHCKLYGIDYDEADRQATDYQA